MESDLTYQKEKIAQLKLQIQELRNSGNSNSYNAQVAVHNTLVADYNSRLNEYRELFSRYEKYTLVHNYILEHMYDRKGVFEYVKTNMPA
jgi:hypothetical protein